MMMMMTYTEAGDQHVDLLLAVGIGRTHDCDVDCDVDVDNGMYVAEVRGGYGGEPHKIRDGKVCQ